MKQTRQMSETIKLGILLAFSGGFMDAYSYIQRIRFLPMPRQGNMLLFEYKKLSEKISGRASLLLPVFAFAIGIAIAELIRAKERDLLHWRQVAVLFERIILVGVAFIP